MRGTRVSTVVIVSAGGARLDPRWIRALPVGRVLRIDLVRTALAGCAVVMVEHRHSSHALRAACRRWGRGWDWTVAVPPGDE